MDEKVKIEFVVDIKEKQKFDLALLMLGKNKDEVFLEFINDLSLKALRTGYRDSQINSLDSDSKSRELERRIKRWAERKDGTYYLIIKSYFIVENKNKDNIVKANEMEEVFNTLDNRPQLDSIVSRFLLNFRLLCSDAPKAYGKLFDYNKDTKEVKISDNYKELLISLKNEFLK